MPGLQEVLVDAAPDAGATAAKAFDNLVTKLGELNFSDIVNELIKALKSHISDVDRQGAAQGLSEVSTGLELERLDGLFPILYRTLTARESTCGKALFRCSFTYRRHLVCDSSRILARLF